MRAHASQAGQRFEIHCRREPFRDELQEHPSGFPFLAYPMLFACEQFKISNGRQQSGASLIANCGAGPWAVRETLMLGRGAAETGTSIPSKRTIFLRRSLFKR